jgi:hypothetical protein
MNFISQLIVKIFKLDYFISMLKLDFNIKKIFSLISVITMTYIIMIPLYKLIKKLLFLNNKSKLISNINTKLINNKISNSNSNSNSIKTFRKYRKIITNIDNESKQSSLRIFSKKFTKKKVKKILRTFKINE